MLGPLAMIAIAATTFVARRQLAMVAMSLAGHLLGRDPGERARLRYASLVAVMCVLVGALGVFLAVVTATQ